MKLATLKEGGRDGTLIVVNRELTRAVRADGIAPTLQSALDDWDAAAPRLASLYEDLMEGTAEGSFNLDIDTLAAPLPRCIQFLDGSAYLPHVERVRKARGDEVPDSSFTATLVYQAVSVGGMAPHDPITNASTAWCIDFEIEIGVFTDYVTMGATP